ncbi:MAG: ABC transporter ATP-binding protein [Chitinophagales bacterium]|nr:ABC transporter ATP-binding protein [Chitinophagales bacterium]
MYKVSVHLDNVSKRYTREWILKNISFEFNNDNSYAVIGPNGSGKSTLIELISTYLTPTEGSISYVVDGQSIPTEKAHNYLSFCSPSLSLIEEMNLKEMLRFHFRFKNTLAGIDVTEIAAQLPFDSRTMIRNYSSGMKQRLKIVLAIFSQSAVLLLDEPTTNLDEQGFKWFENLLRTKLNNRLLLMSSNLQREIDLCSQRISILDYKKVKAI